MAQHKQTVTIFGEEATSALAGFHAGPLSKSNWSLEMLFFQEGEKLSEQGESKQQTQPTHATILVTRAAPQAGLCWLRGRSDPGDENDMAPGRNRS